VYEKTLEKHFNKDAQDEGVKNSVYQLERIQEEAKEEVLSQKSE